MHKIISYSLISECIVLEKETYITFSSKNVYVCGDFGDARSQHI